MHLIYLSLLFGIILAGEPGEYEYGGAFWQRKLATFFKRLDTNSDGKITEHDFLSIADRCSIGENKYSEDAQRAHKLLQDLWTQYWKPAGDSLTAEVFADLVKQQGKHVQKVASDAFFSTLFDVVDATGTGIIGKKEFDLFFKSIGDYNAGRSNDAFNAIDEDRDGKLSKDDFIRAGRDFSVEGDPSLPGNQIFGPLI